jgi:hypothetical protein
MAIWGSDDKKIEVADAEYETDDDELRDDLWLKVDADGIEKLTHSQYSRKAKHGAVEFGTIADEKVKVNDHSDKPEPPEDLFYLIEKDEVREEIAEYIDDGRTVIIGARINKDVLAGGVEDE